MVKNTDGKKILLSGWVPEETRDEFWKTVPKGSKHGDTLGAAAKLWISLPEECRVRLVSQTMTEDAFIELLRHIVSEKIDAGADSQDSAGDAVSVANIKAVTEAIREDKAKTEIFVNNATEALSNLFIAIGPENIKKIQQVAKLKNNGSSNI